jgi:hypothetical protein
MIDKLKNQFFWDLRVSPLFSMEEPHGERNDVSASFAGIKTSDAGSVKRKLVIAYRAVVLVGLISVMTLDLLDRPLTVWIYFGYLTNMALMFSIAYFLFSLLCTVFINMFCSQPRGSSSPHPVVLLTWMLYSLAAPIQLQQTVLFWVMLPVYQWYIDFMAILKHGIIALLLIVDAAIIGKIPIRVKHFIPFLVVFLFYTIWSIALSLKGKGDGYFDWGENSQQSTRFAFIAVFVFAPLVCALLWLVSFIGGGRRLVSTTKFLPYAQSYVRSDIAETITTTPEVEVPQRYPNGV